MRSSFSLYFQNGAVQIELKYHHFERKLHYG